MFSYGSHGKNYKVKNAKLSKFKTQCSPFRATSCPGQPVLDSLSKAQPHRLPLVLYKATKQTNNKLGFCEFFVIVLVLGR